MFLTERNLNPKTACLKRREDEKNEEGAPNSMIMMGGNPNMSQSNNLLHHSQHQSSQQNHPHILNIGQAPTTNVSSPNNNIDLLRLPNLVSYFHSRTLIRI